MDKSPIEIAIGQTNILIEDEVCKMECLCRKLVKYGLIDKVDGYYQTHEIRTNTHECVKDTHDKIETCSEIPNNCEPQTLDDIGRQIQDAYDKGLLSDASAVQAWYEAVKDEPQTDCAWGKAND